jgi:HD-GYP domain-containing protein (c-di-GMP phosphodiesterase class II)
VSPGRPAATAALAGLRDELRALGVVWIACDAAGAPCGEPPPSDDFVSTLLFRAPGVRWALAERVPSLDGPAEILPGIVAIASPAGRRAATVQVALVPLADVVESPYLPGLCGGAGLDVSSMRSALAAARLVTRDELPRIAGLVRVVQRIEREREADRIACLSLGEQLAASYEEIHLLHTLASSMAVGGDPSAFLDLAARQLVATLSCGFAAVFLREGDASNGVPDRLVVAGDAPPARAAIVELARRRLAADGGATILDADDPSLAALGLAGPVLACPVRRDSRTLGFLVAGGLPAATNVELKLAEAAADHVAIHLENASLYRDLDAMFLGTLEALTAAIDAKDAYTRGHSQRVAYLARELAAAIGLPEPTVKQVRIAGLVHDIGKIGVPESTLRKSGRLDDAEFEQVKRHPEIGWRILKDIPQMREMLDGVLSHHERWDGRGYPHALAGDGIPLFGRIIALADTFDAMSSNRTYRSGRDRATVLAEIRRNAGTQFDPRLVEAFLSLDLAGFDRLLAAHLAGAEEQPS